MSPSSSELCKDASTGYMRTQLPKRQLAVCSIRAADVPRLL